MDTKTDFGFSQVSPKKKTLEVKKVFSSVHRKYDLMNDLMSFGFHHLWKKFAVDLCRLKKDEMVLDLAGGTGDVTKALADVVGDQNLITTDINNNMLQLGRRKLLDSGVNAMTVQCDAQSIPFAEASFDCVTVAFGVRNMTDKAKALEEIYRVLKLGGKVVILEFSNIWKPLEKIYDAYSFNFLPYLGEKITGDKHSYKYLVESIRMHPNQEEFQSMMEKSGFNIVDFFNLGFGVVAIHRGYKC